MPDKCLAVGDEVAVLPYADAPASKTLAVVTIAIAGPVYVQLSDGRFFASIGGQSLLVKNLNVIVPATNAHRLAVKKG